MKTGLVIDEDRDFRRAVASWLKPGIARRAWNFPANILRKLHDPANACGIIVTGNGGVPDANAKTAEQVPGLIRVADGYTKAELKSRILSRREIIALDPKRPPPPLYMPAWGAMMKDAEADDLVAYLISLKPKGEDVGI